LDVSLSSRIGIIRAKRAVTGDTALRLAEAASGDEVATLPRHINAGDYARRA
jgi:hypothetical protein